MATNRYRNSHINKENNDKSIDKNSNNIIQMITLKEKSKNNCYLNYNYNRICHFSKMRTIRSDNRQNHIMRRI